MVSYRKVHPIPTAPDLRSVDQQIEDAKRDNSESCFAVILTCLGLAGLVVLIHELRKKK